MIRPLPHFTQCAIAPEHSTADSYLDTVVGAVGSFLQNKIDGWCGASISYSLLALVFQETGTTHLLLNF